MNVLPKFLHIVYIFKFSFVFFHRHQHLGLLLRARQLSDQLNDVELIVFAAPWHSLSCSTVFVHNHGGLSTSAVADVERYFRISQSSGGTRLSFAAARYEYNRTHTHMQVFRTHTHAGV